MQPRNHTPSYARHMHICSYAPRTYPHAPMEHFQKTNESSCLCNESITLRVIAMHFTTLAPCPITSMKFSPIMPTFYTCGPPSFQPCFLLFLLSRVCFDKVCFGM